MGASLQFVYFLVGRSDSSQVVVEVCYMRICPLRFLVLFFHDPRLPRKLICGWVVAVFPPIPNVELTEARREPNKHELT